MPPVTSPLPLLSRAPLCWAEYFSFRWQENPPLFWVLTWAPRVTEVLRLGSSRWLVWARTSWGFLHLSHHIKWGYFPAVSSYSKAQCLLIEDTGIHAQKECGNSINEGNLVLIAAMWALDLLRQRQVIKGDSTMMIRPSPWLWSFLHLKSFQASGSHCYNWQHRWFTCLLPHVLDFPKLHLP